VGSLKFKMIAIVEQVLRFGCGDRLLEHDGEIEVGVGEEGGFVCVDGDRDILECIDDLSDTGDVVDVSMGEDQSGWFEAVFEDGVDHGFRIEAGVDDPADCTVRDGDDVAVGLPWAEDEALDLRVLGRLIGC